MFLLGVGVLGFTIEFFFFECSVLLLARFSILYRQRIYLRCIAPFVVYLRVRFYVSLAIDLRYIGIYLIICVLVIYPQHRHQ